MKDWTIIAGLLFVTTAVCVASERPACISPREAQQQIGKKQCVSGKVLAVKQSPDGMMILDFCSDTKNCTFTAVVSPADTEYVGDVSELVGRTVEIRGKIKEYKGQAKIVLQDADQLHGMFQKRLFTPTEFDVEKRGRASAGTFHAAKPRKASRKRSAPPTGTVDVGNPDSPD